MQISSSAITPGFSLGHSLRGECTYHMEIGVKGKADKRTRKQSSLKLIRGEGCFQNSKYFILMVEGNVVSMQEAYIDRSRIQLEFS